MKNLNITIICLTLITIADAICGNGVGASVLLWIGYGIYRVDYKK